VFLNLPVVSLLAYDSKLHLLRATIFFWFVLPLLHYIQLPGVAGQLVEDRPGFSRHESLNFLYIVVFLAMSWYYFVGGVRAALGVHGEFHRTPKGEAERPAAMPRINTVMMVGEVFTFIYSCLAIMLALRERNYMLIPMNFTVCLGFGMVLF